MSSPFSGGGYIDVARGVAKSTKRGEFFYCWPSSAPGVAELLLDLLLGLGIEVGYVKHPANFNYYVILGMREAHSSASSRDFTWMIQ
jgi:hypothetical protein